MKLAWFGIFLLEAVSSSEESELYCEVNYCRNCISSVIFSRKYTLKIIENARINIFTVNNKNSKTCKINRDCRIADLTLMSSISGLF